MKSSRCSTRNSGGCLRSTGSPSSCRDLENRTIKEVARTLAWPPGTVAGRLARGRKMLAERLARRGVLVSAGVVAGPVLENAASACVPAALVVGTMQTVRLSVGQARVPGLLSVKTVTLMEGVMQAMAWKKLKMAAFACILLGIGVGAGVCCLHTPAAQQSAALPSPAAKARPRHRPEAERKEYYVQVRLMEASAGRRRSIRIGKSSNSRPWSWRTINRCGSGSARTTRESWKAA